MEGDVQHFLLRSMSLRCLGYRIVAVTKLDFLKWEWIIEELAPLESCDTKRRQFFIMGLLKCGSDTGQHFLGESFVYAWLVTIPRWCFAILCVLSRPPPSYGVTSLLLCIISLFCLSLLYSSSNLYVVLFDVRLKHDHLLWGERSICCFSLFCIVLSCGCRNKFTCHGGSHLFLYKVVTLS